MYPLLLWYHSFKLVLLRRKQIPRKNQKGQIEPKQLSQNKNSTKHESGEVPDTILPVKKTIRNTITSKGFIEDPDAIPNFNRYAKLGRSQE